MQSRATAPMGRFPQYTLSVCVAPKRYFIATGEFRRPQEGEWYLSGAIVEAYMAPRDLSIPYWIAKECGHAK